MPASKRKNAAAGQKNMNMFYIVLAVVAVVGIGAIVYSMRGGSGGSMATEPLNLSLASADSLLNTAQGVTIGEQNAPVQVIVFSDFQCPGCGVWQRNIETNLKPEFVESGKVRYTYYDYPIISIHAHAFLAARAARCANDQGRFWDYHDRLFAGQNQWGFARSAPVDQFTAYATELGLDANAFTQCLRSERHADVVTANALLGEQLGVRGTPTVFVGQRRLGDNEWSDYAAVSAAIEAAGGV
ncbi:MAG TPA: thioredoxin domain-containing protein [Longimicrobiales bacterium]|nr:thioredoxin domain-containing protein [Longimicrobiales bacterium]